MSEAHAMVSLVEQGWADQNDVARAFGYSARTAAAVPSSVSKRAVWLHWAVPRVTRRDVPAWRLSRQSRIQQLKARLLAP